MVHSSFKVCWPCQWTVSTDIHRLDQNHILGSSLKNLSSIYMFVMVNIKHPINNICNKHYNLFCKKTQLWNFFFKVSLRFIPRKIVYLDKQSTQWSINLVLTKQQWWNVHTERRPWTIIISLPSLICAFWHIFPC